MVLHIFGNMIMRSYRFRKNSLFWIYVIIPLIILVVYVISSAHWLVFVMTFIIYYPAVIISLKFCRKVIMIPTLILIVFIIICSRIYPVKKFPIGKDSTVFSEFQVKTGEAIEQDFFLPKSDWRFNRLMNDESIEVVLRSMIDFDVQNSNIYINGKDIGKLSSLMLYKSDKFFYNVFPVYNFLFKLPKDLLKNKDKITIRIVSKKVFKIGYSSGIHPLPKIPHSRLIKTDGTVEDISDRYYNRRFRFQNVILFISKKYIVDSKNSLIKDDSLIFGALL